MSAVQVRRSVPLPSTINIIEEGAPKLIEKQGISAILGSNLQQNQIPPSLRRTLSANMSSEKWLSQNGMSPMRRISSFDELATASTKVDDQEELKQNMPTHDDVWKSIQSQTEKGSLWSSILSEKKDNNQTPPYVHPLLRKSTSNLSQKSLEICTESLGSESGSDGASSYPLIETSGDKINEKEEKIEPTMQSFEDFHVAKYNYNPGQKKVAQKKSFPPPLPSLSNRNDGCTSLQMQSHRKNGRLVVEAVSVPQQNFFQVDRQDGRLVLTLINNDPQEPNTLEKLEEKVGDFQKVFDTFEEFDNADGFEGHEEEEKVEMEHQEDQMTIVIEQNPSRLPTSGMINIPMMKSFLGMGKKDSLWSNKINEVVELMEAEQMVGKLTTIQQSLPPPAAAMTQLVPLSATKPPLPPASVASFNVYGYFWRRNNKNSVTEIIGSSILTQQCSWNDLKDYNNDKAFLAKRYSHQQEVVIMRVNKGDFFVPLVCKENRRSLLVWQPHCIATS